VNEEISLSPGINIIVGPNNNGKTTLLNAVSILQQPRIVVESYSRLNSSLGTVRVWVDRTDLPGSDPRCDNYFTQTNEGSIQGRQGDQVVTNWQGFPNSEPNNFVIPYQSKRKVGGYSENITLNDVSQVTGTLSNLYAKVDRIANPEFQPAYDEYVKACDEILGFRVSTTNSGSGKKAAFVVRNEQNIPIDMMGEGISNLLGLIVDLCRVENKLFIIEEPENDIHPRALKRLLDLIVEKASKNQFIITTHSNIVLKHLGASPGTLVFNVQMTLEERIPTSVIHVVDTMEKRRAALEDLGYEPFDYELWDYWIFFEEASAERIFREFFIPWYAPKLKSKVRTFSARTVSEVAVKFDDFNRLFVFLHLQEEQRPVEWCNSGGAAPA
jgi:energy-coupling factor transporter ATP-binding protein EcfA2